MLAQIQIFYNKYFKKPRVTLSQVNIVLVVKKLNIKPIDIHQKHIYLMKFNNSKNHNEKNSDLDFLFYL